MIKTKIATITKSKAATITKSKSATITGSRAAIIRKALQKLKTDYESLVNESNAKMEPKGLYDVFNDIENASSKNRYSFMIARQTDNRDQNRYSNVLPSDDNRFQSDNVKYINASGYENYIFTQGPMKNYLYKFWNMCWDSNCRCIVAVSRSFEKGTSKYDEYYPVSKEELVYLGPDSKYTFNVSLDSIEETGDVTIRKLRVTRFANLPVTNRSELSQSGYISQEDFSDIESVDEIKKFPNDAESRIITQIHYTGWPDHGTPKKVSDFLEICTEVNQIVMPNEPIIVHCSAGIGRTGTFCVIHKILKLVESYLQGKTINVDNDLFDINKLILEIRKYRKGLVQTEEQFQFCFIAIIDGVEKLLNQYATD